MKISIATLILTLCLLPFHAAAQSDGPETDSQEMSKLAADQEDAHAELESLVKLLRERLQQDPNNPNDWLMLARTYVYMDKPAKAAEAFRQTRQQFGDSPDLLASEAEYLMLAAGGKVDEDTEALAMRALEMRPGFGRALWLAGIAHYQRNDYEQAGKYWQQVLAQLPAGSEAESMVREALDDLADRGVTLDQQQTESGSP